MIFQLLFSSRSKYHNNLQRESQQLFQPDTDPANIESHWEHYKHVCNEWAATKRSCNNCLIELSVDEDTGATTVTRTYQKTFPIQKRIEVNKPVDGYVTVSKQPTLQMLDVWLDELNTTTVAGS